MRAHDWETGELEWEDAFSLDDRCLCRARDLLAHQGRVFVAGDDGNGSTWIVRSYDARRGHLLWHDELAGSPTLAGERSIFGPQAVAIHDGRLFVAGSIFNLAGNADLLLRAYDAR